VVDNLRKYDRPTGYAAKAHDFVKKRTIHPWRPRRPSEKLLNRVVWGTEDILFTAMQVVYGLDPLVAVNLTKDPLFGFDVDLQTELEEWQRKPVTSKGSADVLEELKEHIELARKYCYESIVI
jgi:hypothetical protein